ncbi:MAG: adenylyltransferase/cytidyltransferase family protein [Candidatus Micrarchaeota archaeon]
MKLVMAFGTFDLLHLGHVVLFQQARALGDKLIVVISRDENVIKIKGKPPLFTEGERLKIVASLKVVDEVVLGDTNNFFAAVVKYRPAVICLGYDQKTLGEKEIREKLDEMGLSKTQVVRLKAFQPEKYKSSILKRICEVK